MHEILATFHGETFCFPGDSANTVIGEFQAEGSPAEKELAEIGIKQKVFSAKGWIDHDSPSLEVGQTYRLHGEWKDYTNRHTGRTTPQFVFRRWIAHIPHSPEGLVKYLALHGKGCNIGPMTARRLVEHFGVESVLQECQDAGKIAALTSATNEEAERFVARIKESEATQNTHVELNNILGKRCRWIRQAAKASCQSRRVRRNRSVGFLSRCCWSWSDHCAPSTSGSSGIPPRGTGATIREAIAACFA